jgi:hypothetical protein
MPKKKQTQMALRQQALERENLRLQRKIATLEAQLVSARNGFIARHEYRPPGGLSEADIEALEKAVKKEQGTPYTPLNALQRTCESLCARR